MRLLIDANLSPRVAAQLADMRFDAIHVADVGLLTAADEAILEYASASQLVIVSADTDFGEMLAVHHRVEPGPRWCCSGRQTISRRTSKPPSRRQTFPQSRPGSRPARWYPLPGGACECARYPSGPRADSRPPRCRRSEECPSDRLAVVAGSGLKHRDDLPHRVLANRA